MAVVRIVTNQPETREQNPATQLSAQIKQKYPDDDQNNHAQLSSALAFLGVLAANAIAFPGTRRRDPRNHFPIPRHLSPLQCASHAADGGDTG